MDFIVKNTTFCSVLDLLCPHSCRGCGALGSVLCNCCKNYILDEHINFCANCKRPILHHACENCNSLPVFSVGRRNELIGRLIEEYKYNSTRALKNVLADLLDGILPCFDGPVVVVPLPTINRHIRERGFDHTLALARTLARLRGWRVEQLLVRTNNSVQVGAGENARIRQAFAAYCVSEKVLRDGLLPNVNYLLLDDVWTTGASITAATRKLREAGALKISIAVLAVS